MDWFACVVSDMSVAQTELVAVIVTWRPSSLLVMAMKKVNNPEYFDCSKSLSVQKKFIRV